MALLDHFTRNAGTEPGDNGFPRYAAHQFAASLMLYVTGNTVRSKTINEFSLTVDDQLQYDELKTVYDAKSVPDRNIHRDTIRACFEQLEVENMTKANASLFMGITDA